MATRDTSVEDIYRLTRLQENLLLHRLHRSGPDDGLILMHGRLRGALRVERLDEAWRATIARHPALRASVHWRDLEHPVQVVAKTARLEATFEDWSDREAGERDERFRKRLARLREAGLDLGRAPVSSWTLVRTSEAEHRFIWACHHVLLDGWSSALVLDEVLARYRALSQGDPFEPAEPPVFRDYVAWSRSAEARSAASRWAVDPKSVWSPLCGSEWTGEAQVDAVLE